MAKYTIEDSTLTGIADAIREKMGTADPIATSAMAEAILALKGGASVDVITASTLPDTVTDGQIVIITDTTPGTVYIDTDEPASPASGDVWVKMEAEATVKLEVTEETPYLRGGLTAAAQWDGSAWGYCDGYLGVDGAWVQFAQAIPPIGTALQDMTWKAIATISASGKAAEYFSIGDAKEIVINGTVGQTVFDNYAISAFIIGIDHNADVEGSNTIHFQIGKDGTTALCLADGNYSATISAEGYFALNYTASNKSGWGTSKMRVELFGNDNAPTAPRADSLIAALPSELRTVMKGVTKYTNNEGGTNVVSATTDYLWLLSEYEVSGACSYSYEDEANYQKQYDYYASGNSKIKYLHYNGTTAAYWWLRSPYSGDDGKFCRINNTGATRTAYANVSNGLAPCFCV